jgi:potassium-dependent mechanosensitive channel
MFKPILCRLLLCVMLVGQLGLVGPAGAETGLETTIESVRASIEAVGDGSLAESEKGELRESYQNTLSFLQRSRDLKTEQAALRQQVEEAPQQLREIQRLRERISKPDPDQLRNTFNRQDLEELEGLLEVKVERMFAWQNELTGVNSELIAAQTRPERTQARVSANRDREQAVEEELRALLRQPESRVQEARQEMLRAERRSLQKSNDLLSQQLAANSTLQELAAQKRDLLSAQIAEIDAKISILQDVINEKRRSLSEQAVSDASAQVLLNGNHQLLREQGSLNRDLSEELLRTTNWVGELTRRNIETKQQIDSLTQIDLALEQQISVLEGSLLLSRILHQQKKTLPAVRIDKRVADQVADLRLRQFELNALRDQLTKPEAYLGDLLGHLPSDQQDSLRPDMEQLIASRVNLVEQLGNNINNLLAQAVTLQLGQRQLQQLSSELQQTIDNQLFWVASNRPLDRIWLLALPDQLVKQWQRLQPLEQLKILGAALPAKWPWLILLAVLLGLHIRWRPVLRRRLLAINEDIDQFPRDSVRHTPMAIALTALLVIPVPAVLAATGMALSSGQAPAMPALGHGLLQLGLAWLVLHLLYFFLAPRDGIAVRHFRWDGELVEHLQRLTGKLAVVMLPLVLIVALNGASPEQMGDDALGRLLMLVGMILLGALLGRMMWCSFPLYHSRILYAGAIMLLTMLPWVLAGMTAWGYHYTSIMLAERFIDTLYLLFSWVLLEGTMVRNLKVAGRRLAYQLALSKNEEEQSRDNGSGEVLVDLPAMDIQQINQQSLRLTKLGIMVLFGVLVYLTWADLLSAVSYLESFTLWEYNSGSGENPALVAVSAADLLVALVIVAFTVTLARNLPGLLEIVVLSRLPLKRGSSYAITTLLSYGIISIGFIFGLSFLGVSWEKLQWLIAALGIGLGFGLQEIFANFVSGLIILLERPVRIGDVVTIGDLSGTVNRIRIRATTITDFDRKEIIVPNKTFVTDQLINWSLSDNVIRVTIRLGVAYGTDLDQVRELLLRVARKNPRVLKDPKPTVLFLNFGDSTLDHALSIHVCELSERNQVIDEINREIERLFQENGIEIAFRRLDINIRNSEGFEKKLVAGKAVTS